MSDSNDTPAGASGPDTPKPDKSKSGKSKPDKPKRRRTGLAAIAIVVAIIAILLAAWSAWQVTRARHAGQAARSQAASQLHDLQTQLATGKQQAAARRLGTLESNLHDLRSAVTNLRAAVKGQGLRTNNLETALARLKGRQQSAHDTLLLDNAEMLLRTGQQRFELFHDSDGAVRAYTQAIAVLAQVQNPAYAPVRTSAITERDALAAAAPPSRQAALDTLSALRGKVATLPLAKPAAASTGKPTQQGWWSRFVDSFRGIVNIAHVGSKPSNPKVGGRFARQMLAVDLVQAQEALLAFDHKAFHDAVQHAAKDLAAQFDPDAGAVRSASAKLAKLLARPAPGKPPQLGGALAQLRSLRASHPSAQPARAATVATPAAAGSSGGTER